MDNNLVAYIRNARAAGKNKDSIFKELLGAGWSVDAISASYSQVETGQSPDMPIPTPKASQERVPQSVAESPKAPHQRTARVILTIGAIFVGLGIFSFISGNWQKIGPEAKVLIIVLSMVIAYTAGFLMQRFDYGKTGNALILLGSLIYGGGIFLIAQIYHLPVEWPDGFLLWMIGVLAVALVIGWRALYSLAIIVGLIGAFGYPWTLFENLFWVGSNRVPVTIATTSLVILIASLVSAVLAALFMRKKLPEGLRRRF